MVVDNDGSLMIEDIRWEKFHRHSSFTIITCNHYCKSTFARGSSSGSYVCVASSRAGSISAPVQVSFLFFCQPRYFLFSQSRYFPFFLSPGLFFILLSVQVFSAKPLHPYVTKIWHDRKNMLLRRFLPKQKTLLWTMTIFQIVIHQTQTQPIFFLRFIFKVSVQTPPEVEVEPASEVSLST